ncbi:MAG: DUF444 family protein [Chromatiales bacterium]|jgi:uncharacterized sporulation protein YeaH/YhbH (DUF444 family)
MTDAREIPPSGDHSRWYELFSRGTRDWLRHNQKVRQAVRRRLAEMAMEPDVLSGDAERKVQVPVRFMEHYRFRLADPGETEGVGQGEAEPGDVLRPGRPGGGAGERGASGEGDGGVELVLEFEADELIEWLWEELRLPNLEPKRGDLEEVEYERAGWDRRGARARLDRRRSLKESIKRRRVQPEGPAFTNEDLRFRQLVQRRRPSTQAAVFFAMDVSSSVSAEERRLAKSFFFWALQGLRRQYARIEPVFIAHTIQAWEFPEQDFFKVTAEGGTVASTAFEKVLEVIEERYDPGAYNLYLFYASDGENFREDRERSVDALDRITALTRFAGYLETASTHRHLLDSETARLFRAQADNGRAVGTFGLRNEAEVWAAIRRFFTWALSDEEAEEA